ncbi:hypothetical protein AB0P05_26485 [Streptomyces flaveolus]|uniref:hypothetical protein n=1 Tax=Streptomyces flaveolus TaxID=67297 RepID=UPI003421E575
MNENITEEQMSEAIDWTSDCLGLIGRVAAGRAVAYVKANYPGGWDAFVAECCTFVVPADAEQDGDHSRSCGCGGIGIHGVDHGDYDENDPGCIAPDPDYCDGTCKN